MAGGRQNDMWALTPGVTEASFRIHSAKEAAEAVVSLAREAARAGTFGVGGLLMDRAGRVLAYATNAVVLQGVVRDPTAHAERQLIDWLFDAQRRGLAIAPRDLIIISSVDPCAMCAGAILASGTNAVALAEDTSSGIHSEGRPHRIPSQLWPEAERLFGLFQVRARPGDARHIAQLLSDEIPAPLLKDAETCFLDSLERTRRFVSNCSLPDSAPETQAEAYEWSKLRAIAKGLSSNVAWPDEPILLQDFLTQQQTAFLANDGCVLIDERRRVLLTAQGFETLSPARTSILEIIRAYVWFRNAAEKELGITLPHQRMCSLIKLRPPSPSRKAVMELGAIGSFLEGRHLAYPLPALGFIQADNSHVAENIVASLPPYYTSVIKLTVGQMNMPAPI